MWRYSAGIGLDGGGGFFGGVDLDVINTRKRVCFRDRVYCGNECIRDASVVRRLDMRFVVDGVKLDLFKSMRNEADIIVCISRTISASNSFFHRE